MAADRRLLVPARRNSHRHLLPNRRAAPRAVASRSGRRSLSRARLKNLMADPIREAIRDRALASGFDAVGFAEAHLDAEARAGLGEFIARGYHGDMGWLAG